jgi:hypothetical protein
VVFVVRKVLVELEDGKVADAHRHDARSLVKHTQASGRGSFASRACVCYSTQQHTVYGATQGASELVYLQCQNEVVTKRKKKKRDKLG